MASGESTGLPLYQGGRTYSATRRLRWGDADRAGRLRLDAIARYLQDVANDDTRDVGGGPDAPWVVRRTIIEIVRPPRIGEMLTLTTYCSGLGRRWADRRTTIEGDRGGRVEAMSLWVFMDSASGRPAQLGPEFLALYEDFTGDRKVSARLRHEPPPADAHARPWPLRSTDFDRLGHVNNAATWEPIEDELTRLDLVPSRAEIEYRDGIEPTDEVELLSVVSGDVGVDLWLTAAGVIRASCTVDAVPLIDT